MGFETLRFDAAPGDLRFCDDGASSIIGPTMLPVLHHQSIGHGTGMCRNMLVESAVQYVDMEVFLQRFLEVHDNTLFFGNINCETFVCTYPL